MRFQALAAASFALFACSSEVSAPPQDAETEPSPAPLRSAAPAASPSLPSGATPITAIGDLLGEYRVAGIDGEALDAPIGIAVSIDGPTLSYEPTCAGFVWSLRFDGARLVTTRFSEAHADPQVPPPPVCAVAIFPEQRRLAEALDAADSAVRTADNGIVLAGEGRSVTLFSQ